MKNKELRKNILTFKHYFKKYLEDDGNSCIPSGAMLYVYFKKIKDQLSNEKLDLNSIELENLSQINDLFVNGNGRSLI